MQATPAISRRNLDELEADIISLSSHLNATEYEILVLIREFDLRQGWKPYHFNNCAEWLNMKCGIAPGTAREKIRVANALFDLAATSEAFQKGDLSYSKARELTRIATPANEEKLLDYAIPATALQVENHCRELRNVKRDVSTVDANRLHKQRYLSRSLHGDGSMTISVQLPKESGDLVMKALELALREMDQEEDAFEGDLRTSGVEENDKKGAENSLHAKQADALVHVAKGYLAGGKERSSSTADHYQVLVHVDEEVLRNKPGESSKSDLPSETVRRLCCDSGLVVVTKDSKGNPLNVSRKHRVVQPSLKRALLARDKYCRFPGCSHEKWLDAQGPASPGITWNTGQMVVIRVSRIRFSSVPAITGCYTKADFESGRIPVGNGSSADVEGCPTPAPDKVQTETERAVLMGGHPITLNNRRT